MKRLFGEKPINSILKDALEGINAEITYLSEYVLDQDLDKISNSLISKYAIKPLKIDFESRASKAVMVGIPGSSFPPDYDVRRNQTYQRAYVKYSFSVYGNTDLIFVAPKNRTFQHDLGIEISSGSQGQLIMSLGYQTRYANLELSEQVKSEVKAAMQPIIEELPEMQKAINAEIEIFNESLNPYVRQKISERKEVIEKTRKQNLDLNDF